MRNNTETKHSEQEEELELNSGDCPWPYANVTVVLWHCLGKTWTSTLPSKKPTVGQSHDTTLIQLGKLINMWGYIKELTSGYHENSREISSPKVHPSKGDDLEKLEPWTSLCNLQATWCIQEVLLPNSPYCLYIFGAGEILRIQEILGTSWDFWMIDILFQQPPLECFKYHWVSLWWKGSLRFK